MKRTIEVPKYEPLASMSKQETMARFCRLQQIVASSVPNGYAHANDCFCGATQPIGPYQNTGAALLWIERVVCRVLKLDEQEVTK